MFQENDGIDDKTKRPKLVLLSFTVPLAQFTALAVEDGTGKTMTAFTAVELNQDAAAIGFVVNVSQQKKSLGDTPKLGNGADEGGGPTAALDGAHKFRGTERAQLERTGDPQHVVPVVGDQIRIQPVASQPIENAVVGGSADAPEPSLTDVGKPRAELVAEQPVQPVQPVASRRTRPPNSSRSPINRWRHAALLLLSVNGSVAKPNELDLWRTRSSPRC